MLAIVWGDDTVYEVSKCVLKVCVSENDVQDAAVAAAAVAATAAALAVQLCQ